MILTPSGASASSMALASTTGGPMAPISPTPLNPPGVKGMGVTMWWISSSGISAMDGIR